MRKIENFINEIRRFISVSKLTYDAWWTLAGYNESDYSPIRKKYPTHFELSKYAYLNTLIVTLYMVLEDDKKTINMWQLIKQLRHEKQFKPEYLNHIEIEINKAKIIWEKIRFLRCNQFSHCNYKHSLDGVFKQANIKPIEFKELISQLEGITNYISNIWNGSTHAFNIDNKHSTKQFMDSLIKQKNERISQQSGLED